MKNRGMEEEELKVKEETASLQEHFFCLVLQTVASPLDYSTFLWLFGVLFLKMRNKNNFLCQPVT